MDALHDFDLERVEGEAESIVLAAEVGVFRGTRSELAHAYLILAARDGREKFEGGPSREHLFT